MCKVMEGCKTMVQSVRKLTLCVLRFYGLHLFYYLRFTKKITLPMSCIRSGVDDSMVRH